MAGRFCTEVDACSIHPANIHLPSKGQGYNCRSSRPQFTDIRYAHKHTGSYVIFGGKTNAHITKHLERHMSTYGNKEFQVNNFRPLMSATLHMTVQS